MNGTWVDLIIIGILAFFVLEGWRVGLWIVLADFLSFLLSLLIGLRGYQLMAEFLRTNFSLSHSVSNALGFLFTAILAEAILGFLFARIIKRIPHKLWKHKASKALSILPSLGEGFILIAFLLTLVMGFPIQPSIKSDIAESRIGSAIIKQTTGIEKRLAEIFGGVIEDSLTYMTIKPGTNERVNLNIEKQELSIDEKAEGEMFALVNSERKKAGLHELTRRPEIVPVARAHARDMWEREYFAHVSPDGKDVGDRLDAQNVNYHLAGENLAMAPTLQTAHTGLMNSEGHRANILEKRFKKMGIGVIDNGYYGKMFVQVFTD